MRRILALLLSISLIMALAACTPDGDNSSIDGEQSTSTKEPRNTNNSDENDLIAEEPQLDEDGTFASTDPEDKVTVMSKGNPTPEEIIAEDPNADIFIWDGVVCINASDIDWVQELDLSGGTSLGEIKRSGIKEDWQNWDATVLEVGTEILELPKSGGVMIARKDSKNIAYLKLLEG